MDESKHINAALADRGAESVVVAANEFGGYFVLYKGDDTPLSVTDEGGYFELSVETAPSRYRYAGHAHSFAGLAREIVARISELRTSGLLSPKEGT
jgi:hypothetical protein